MGPAPALAVFLLAALPADAPAADQAPEIGYVEDYDYTTPSDAIVRAGGEVPLERLTPIRSGDRFRLADTRAKVVLRVAGSADRVIVSQANEGVPIGTDLPEPGFWSGLLHWVGSSIVVFDRTERTQMTAEIRGGGDRDLMAPMLAVPQVLAAGRRKIAVGWLAPDVISIGISGGGKVIAEGKGVGGLWIGPEVDLRPGKYVLTLKGADGTVAEDIRVVAAADLPKPPGELTRADILGGLGETALGVWFAAEGKQYFLEALQHVAADSSEFKPAGIVVDALIAGMQPSPPP
jgi:hypothetical protein